MARITRALTTVVLAAIAFILLVRFTSQTTVGALAGIYLLATAAPRLHSSARGSDRLLDHVDCWIAIALLARYACIAYEGPVATLRLAVPLWMIPAWIGLVGLHQIGIARAALFDARKDASGCAHSEAARSLSTEESLAPPELIVEEPNEVRQNHQLPVESHVYKLRCGLPTICFSAVDRGCSSSKSMDDWILAAPNDVDIKALLDGPE